MRERVNPKDTQALRDEKVPLDLIEPAASKQIALAMATGAKKYGRRNFVNPQTPIHATTYVAAIRRHLDDWMDGEDNAPDTGLSHIAHIGANVNVMLAAMSHGTFIDDRFPDWDEQTAEQAERSRRSNGG